MDQEWNDQNLTLSFTFFNLNFSFSIIQAAPKSFHVCTINCSSALRRAPWLEPLFSSRGENSVHFAFDPPSVSQSQGNDTEPPLSATTESQAAKAINEATTNEALPGDMQGTVLDKAVF